MKKKYLGWYRSGGFKLDPFLNKEDKRYFEKALKKLKEKDYVIDKDGAKMAMVADRIAKREAIKDEKFLQREFKRADKF